MLVYIFDKMVITFIRALKNKYKSNNYTLVINIVVKIEEVIYASSVFSLFEEMKRDL